MKIALSLAVLLTSALWADEAADRTAIETTISALNISSNNPQTKPELFTADFPNAAELQSVRDQKVTVVAPGPVAAEANGTKIATSAGTVVISRQPMGEAVWYPTPGGARRFVTRSVTFVAADSAVVVAVYERQTVLFVLKREATDWRIASFRVLPEAQTR